MIHSVFIFNTLGKPRLVRFYSSYFPPVQQANLVSQIFNLVHTRADSLCNFVDLPQSLSNANSSTPLKIVYRNYATLYFVFVVDQAESQLAILDLIQVFVESLDRCFENVCELDLIFHFDNVHALLSCIIVGGLVLDTSIDSISASYKAMMKAAKPSSTALDTSAWADKFSFSSFSAIRR